MKEHSKSNQERYRTKEEIETWKEKDPIKRIRKILISEGPIGEEEAEQIEEQGRQAIAEALEYTKIIPEPAVDTILQRVYA